MFVFERDIDKALVIAAGVPRSWAVAGDGYEVERLPTHYGVLSYKFHREPRARDGALRLRLEIGGDLQMPPGGIVVASPVAKPLTSVSVNGRVLTDVADREVTIREFPADVVLTY
jgi:hypothetical protein